MEHTTTEINIPTAVNHIVSAATVAINLAGMNHPDALDFAAQSAREVAHDARTRTGFYTTETTTRQIEDATFVGSVAADILDGTTERPSTGNVRAYALALLTDTDKL